MQANTAINSTFGMVCVLTLATILLASSPVYAQINTPMGAVLCQMVEMTGGNFFRGLSTLAVVVVGIGATLGKVSWGLAITVAVGISVVGNAYGIAGLLGVGASC